MDNNFETTQSPIMSENSSTNIAGRRTVSINIKTAIIVAAVVVIGALAFYFKGLFIAATVNGYPISRFAVIQELEKMSGKQALEGIIIRRLIEDEARKKGIAVSDQDIQEVITSIENNIKSQGGTLDEALLGQGLSRKDFMEQIRIQKTAEKILADKIQIGEEEVEKYITDNQVSIPKGQESDYKNQIKEQLKSQKLDREMGAWISSFKSQASINYFVNY